MYTQSGTFSSVLFAAGVISIFESIVWILLAIYGILNFNCVFPAPEYDNEGITYTTLYKFYLEGSECRVKGDPPGYPDVGKANLTKPSELYTWVIIYLVMSLTMLILSMNLFKYKMDEILKFKIKSWCSLMGILLMMDLILTCFFVRDFFRLKEYLREDPKNIGNIPAIMFVLSARGFALWLINLFYVIYYVVWLTNFKVTEKKTDKVNARELMMAYDNYGFNNSTWFEACDKGQITDVTFYEPPSPRRTLVNRRVSVNSSEAVTPFNVEEYVHTPIKKPNFVINQKQSSTENQCCAEGMNGSVYHGHNCSRLKSELEVKLQTWRQKAEQKSSTISDFSHDLKNFKRGPGKIAQQTDLFPKKEKIRNKTPIMGGGTSGDYDMY